MHIRSGRIENSSYSTVGYYDGSDSEKLGLVAYIVFFSDWW